MTHRVMGLDLAAEQSGVALPDNTTVAIRAPKVTKRARTLADDQVRMDHIDTTFRALLDDYQPTLLVVEDYAAGMKGNPVHRLAEIGGLIRLACWRASVPIALINPTHVKIYATGHGGATKSQMATSAQGRTGLVFPTEDECDAWWMRAMGCEWLGQPIVKVPQSQRDVLERVKGWPEVTR
ncbi:Holliday junction resolvasome RuvABC endonuclease subunit [Thermocatellispora tengchongensis]|uniref:Holliday junction resolvasome RuvABC endonuclease subunit n=1 Tax=Thermocatellispora tengchongensis TaxID=1073253 RepID=A0A840PTP4_9ACTN|nr:crossover junction endodeoxyribonuclease RuvC [Thermocatellispora tengchongensis]MBB5140517.1 Holliday junction resolvasome RuvABC endonuclease subunit [Thermocatellispora tengchongensis]